MAQHQRGPLVSALPCPPALPPGALTFHPPPTRPPPLGLCTCCAHHFLLLTVCFTRRHSLTLNVCTPRFLVTWCPLLQRQCLRVMPNSIWVIYSHLLSLHTVGARSGLVHPRLIGVTFKCRSKTHGDTKGQSDRSVSVGWLYPGTGWGMYTSAFQPE